MHAYAELIVINLVKTEHIYLKAGRNILVFFQRYVRTKNNAPGIILIEAKTFDNSFIFYDVIISMLNGSLTECFCFSIHFSTLIVYKKSFTKADFPASWSLDKIFDYHYRTTIPTIKVQSRTSKRRACTFACERKLKWSSSEKSSQWEWRNFLNEPVRQAVP